MPVEGHCKEYPSSYFLIDRSGNLTSYAIHPANHLSEFISQSPQVGALVEEFITQKYRRHFLKLFSRCLAGECISVERKYIYKGTKGLSAQIAFTPVPLDGETCAVCTVVESPIAIDELRALSDYSHLTSHQLRAPIANILSLSDTTNYTHIESFDLLKINRLLSEINVQAEKLDTITKMLNSLINQNEQLTVFEPSHLEKKREHIVLVDDDPLTNKIHQALIQKYYAGKQVVLFSNPEIALAYIRSTDPDLVLLDVHMPEIDAWKFLEIMVTEQIHIDVIIVSSSIDPRERARAKSFPFVRDFITKPLTYDKIRAVLEGRTAN